MARAALGWSLTRLAAEANIGRATAARFELGENVNEDTISALEMAFIAAGISLLGKNEVSRNGGEGVRFSQTKLVGSESDQ